MEHRRLGMFVGAAALAAGASAVGCKRKSDDDGAGRAGTASAELASGARPEPFTGALTIDRVLGARNLVQPFDPWEPGLARMEALLGKPTQVDGARHTWAVVEGEACAYVYITKDNGADYQVEGVIVGTVQAPARTTADGAGGDHVACPRAAGGAVGPPEDPSAAGPPTDGSVVALAEMRRVVIVARSRWQGARVKVAAVMGDVSTTTSGSDRYVTVALTTGPGDQDEPLRCGLAPNQAVPAGLSPGEAVIAEGTIEIEPWTALGGGTIMLKPALRVCSLGAAPAT